MGMKEGYSSAINSLAEASDHSLNSKSGSIFWQASVTACHRSGRTSSFQVWWMIRGIFSLFTPLLSSSSASPGSWFGSNGSVSVPLKGAISSKVMKSTSWVLK